MCHQFQLPQKKECKKCKKFITRGNIQRHSKSSNCDKPTKMAMKQKVECEVCKKFIKKENKIRDTHTNTKANNNGYLNHSMQICPGYGTTYNKEMEANSKSTNNDIFTGL